MLHKNLVVTGGMLLVVGGVLLGTVPAPAAEVPAPAVREVDPRVWSELDIVPMPKNIRLTDDNLVLDPAEVILMIAPDASQQSQIGADWINQRLQAVGGAAALPVVAGTDIPAGKTAIIIGTMADNPLIAQAVNEKIANVGANNPGERGYEIRRSGDGKRIYLAGADDIGALYACVTFGELLECQSGTVSWRATEVRDWPDLIWLIAPYAADGYWAVPELRTVHYRLINTENPAPELVDEYNRLIREYYDRLLRRKYSVVKYDQRCDGMPFKPARYHNIIKDGIAYGRARGFDALLYAEKPFAGRKERYPEIAADRVCPTNPAPAVFRYDREWIRCWSLDDLTRKTARNLAEFVQAIGYTRIGFHDTDTGVYDNPAQWEERCAFCRERWGDDYAAAVINKHRIYYEELKKLNPDVRVDFTLYPYYLSILDPGMDGEICSLPLYNNTPESFELLKRHRARLSDFYSQLNEAFPSEDVTFGIREANAPSVQAFRALTPGRGTFTWLALMSHAWRPLFSEAAVWSATFVDNSRDIFGVVAYMDMIIPLESLAVREYSWSRETPGARPWDRVGYLGGVRGSGNPAMAEEWRHAEPEGEIYTKILPRLARNCFSREAAPFIVTAVSQNIDLQQIFNRQKKPFTWLKDAERMQWQADNVTRAMAAMDELWAKIQTDEAGRLGLDDFSLKLVVNLRERLHMGLWAAKAREQNLKAYALSVRGDRAGVQAAVANGLEYCREGNADRERLLAERPESVSLRGTFQLDTASSSSAVLEKSEAALKATLAQADDVIAAASIPPRIINKLAQNRVVHATRVSTPPLMGGKKADPAWRTAWPVESLLVFDTASPRPSAAHFCGRLLYDADNLYLWTTAFAAAGEPAHDRDGLELFLQPPGLKGDYIHFFMSIKGKLRQQYNRKQMNEAKVVSWQSDDIWKMPGVEYQAWRKSWSWQGWLKIPLADLGGPGGTGWRINLGRDYPGANGREFSSTQKSGAGGFHDLTLYSELKWSDAPCPAAAVELAVTDFNVKTMTLPDGIASVASFRVGITSDRVLYDAKLTAEAYDDAGKLQARLPPVTLDRVMYDWTAPDEYIIEYNQVHPKGRVLIKVSSADGAAEQWAQFGGREDVPLAAEKEGEKEL